MREVLFRGKTLYDGEWMFGSLVKVEDECVIIAEDAVYYGGSDFSKGCAVDPATVGQFTGLTDKNGKRIFEGDILFVPRLGKAYEVKYELGQFCVGINQPIAYERHSGEVIGNIHDNPELLKGGCQ